MAPLRPLPSKGAAPSKSILKTRPSGISKPTHKNNSVITAAASTASSGSLFSSTKEDKRRIKRATLLSRVEKSKVASKNAKRREKKRLNNSLEANLESLGDVLAELADDSSADQDLKDGVERRSQSNGMAGQVNVIKRKTLKSKPGAMKRKLKQDNAERERFGRNLAQMSGSSATDANGQKAGVQGTGALSLSDRLKALRGFIGETLERRESVVSAA